MLKIRKFKKIEIQDCCLLIILEDAHVLGFVNKGSVNVLKHGGIVKNSVRAVIIVKRNFTNASVYQDNAQLKMVANA